MSDLKYKYHELIAINSNIKLTLIREARKTEAPLKKKKKQETSSLHNE